MAPTMAELREVGANWVATHPYAWISGTGEVRFESIDPERPPANLPADLTDVG